MGQNMALAQWLAHPTGCSLLVNGVRFSNDPSHS